MRFLSRQNGRLIVTEDLQTAPEPYAILSHTWGDEEVVFLDVREDTAQNKAGLAKLDFCLQQAARDGYQKVWIDTCCIDKRNNSELAEAINLMFEYYAGAAVCYVYLSDVWYKDWQETFVKSRWFTRGWTLQELLAPQDVRFFSCDRQYLGDKASLCTEIHAAAQIDLHIPLNQVSIPDRYKWSLDRQTTKLEDHSYCLLGLLEVKLGFNYGEREEARERLFEEVELEHGRRTGREIRHLHLAWTQRQRTTVAEREDLMTLEDLQKSLTFPDMTARQTTISNPFANTCSWILSAPEYRKWSQLEHRILWIKGNPGAGKSTLIRHAEQACQSKHICFYFNARGSDLAKTTFGLYRSLLFQLLDAVPAVRAPVLDRIRNETRQGNSWTLITARVKDTLRYALSRIERPIQCFIDALDECAVEEVQDMIYLFEDCQLLHICFASRYYPALSIANSLNILLERQSEHFEDLSGYVYGRLEIDGPAGDKLKNQVINKANGVFFWAFLVVRMLNEELRNGNLYNVQATLDALPGGLIDLLERLVSGGEQLLRFHSCIQWLLFAFRPLKDLEFYFAVITSLADAGELKPTAYTTPFDPDLVTAEFLAKFVSSASRGLAEVANNTVQVIHESVRDYFLEHGGLGNLFTRTDKTRSPPRLEECTTEYLGCRSHDMLKRCCQQYLLAVGDDERNFPFLEYSGRYAIKHGDEAARHVDQKAFIEQINKKNLRFLDSSKVYGTICVLPGAVGESQFNHDFHELDTLSTISILAACDAGRLIHTASALGMDVNRDGLALAFALPPIVGDCLIPSALTALLDCGVRIDDQAPYGNTALSQAALNRNAGIATLLLKRGASARVANYEGQTPLHLLVRDNRRGYGSDCVGLFKLLLKHGADIDARDAHGVTPLMLASEYSLPLVRVMLENFANVQAKSDCCLTALSLAFNAQDRNEILELLLEHGPDQGDKDSALIHACDLDDIKNVRLLLDKGANANAKQSYADLASVLFTAIRSGRSDMVEALMASGADIEARDAEGRTALMFACHHSRRGIVELLLGNGADIEALDYQGHSVSTWAQKERCVEWCTYDGSILEMLLRNYPQLCPQDAYTKADRCQPDRVSEGNLNERIDPGFAPKRPDRKQRGQCPGDDLTEEVDSRSTILRNPTTSNVDCGQDCGPDWPYQKVAHKKRNDRAWSF